MDEAKTELRIENSLLLDIGRTLRRHFPCNLYTALGSALSWHLIQDSRLEFARLQGQTMRSRKAGAAAEQDERSTFETYLTESSGRTIGEVADDLGIGLSSLTR